jgi:hypothetical protein
MRVNYNFDMNKLARHFTYEITLESNNKKSRAVGYGYIGQNSAHFFSSRLIDICNKTELKIMRYIDVTLKDHSSSLKLSNKDIAVSLGLNSSDEIGKSIKSLCDKHIIVNWKDILGDDFDHIIIPAKYYFVNPNYLHHINATEYEANVNATIHKLEDTSKTHEVDIDWAVVIIE